MKEGSLAGCDLPFSCLCCAVSYIGMEANSSNAGYLISDYWVHVSNQFNGPTKMPDTELHQCIVDTMLSSCFFCDDHKAEVREKLLEAMPLFHAHIRNTTLKRKIKIVKDIAASVKCEIGQRLEYYDF